MPEQVSSTGTITPTPATGAPWLYKVTTDSQTHVVVFKTEDRYVDHNIRAEITVSSGTVTPKINISNLGTYATTSGATSESYDFMITPQANTEKGYIPTTLNNAPISGTSVYYKINTAVVTTPTTNNTANANIELVTSDDSTKASVNVKEIVIGTPSTTEPDTSGEYFLAFKGTSKVNIGTAGWIPTGDVTASSITKYFPIRAASFSSTVSSKTISATATINSVANVATASTDSSGIYVQLKGTATASVTAKVVVSTSGYIPAASDGTASSTASTTTSTTSNIYINAVTIGASKSFTVSSNSGTLAINANTATINIKSSSGTITVTSNSTTHGVVNIVGKFNSNPTATDNSTVKILDAGKIVDVSPTFSGGTIVDGSSTATGSNVTVATTAGTNANGVYVQTQYKAGVAAVTYSSAYNGWIHVASGAQAKAKVNAPSSYSNGAKLYITSLTIPARKTLPITIANSSTAADVTSADYRTSITVGNYRSVTMTNAATVYVANTTTSSKVTIKSKSEATAQDIISAGEWVTNTAAINTTTADVVYYGKFVHSKATRAILANTATTGVSYSTTNAPVLVSGSGLYINAGYIDNTYISLATLIPDSITNTQGFAEASYILANYGAFDASGNEIIGTIQTYGGQWEVITVT